MTAAEQETPPAEGSGEGVPALRIGEVLSVDGLSQGRVLALAGAAPEGSTDPVVLAVADAVADHHPGVVIPEVAEADVDPASPQRRYSLLRVRGLRLGDGSTRDVMVMRGDLAAVLGAAATSREGRQVLRRNAQHSTLQGGRPFAVAAAAIAPDGTVGEYRVQGFVGVHPQDGGQHDPASGEGEYIRFDLWSISLRYQHWLNVVMIFVLSCTGYFIMDPFFGPVAHEGAQPGYLMGWVRFIHFTAAFIWLVVGATRIVSAFTSRDKHLRWPTLWPIKSRRDLRNLGETVGHYAFVRAEAPLYLAHNPLQQLAYTTLYVAGGVQMLTGFTLYGLYHQSNPFWALVSTPVHWFGIAPVRMFHACMMFLLWAFAIMHIYLAVRADSLERHGGVSAMLNGGVWVRRGTRFEDAPDVG